MARYLIVNADDFGLSTSVNCGIKECIESGILTSASLMVRQPAAAEASAYAKKNHAVSVGLHVDFGEWIYQNGDWVRLYEVVPVDDGNLVNQEFRRQLAAFRKLIGRNPSHLDSHQHAHRNEPVRSILMDAARRLSIPLRECDPLIRYCGAFYGQTGEGEPLAESVGVNGLKKILKTLSNGVTELGCHPGYAGGYRSVYLAEREWETRTLCDPEIKASLREWSIELRNFSDLPHLQQTFH